jgi:nitrate reductase NapE component
MLKLLVVTLGTWSVISLLLVGTLGFLLHFRQQTAPAPAVRRAV